MRINRKKFIYLISPTKINKSFYQDLTKVLQQKKVSFFQLRLKKDTLKKKLDRLNQEILKINQRLTNKNFVEKAPAELIDQEKTNFNNLEKDVKKIQLTLENL